MITEMATLILRLGYSCKPRRRPDVISAIRQIDAIGAPVGWPGGRFVSVDTRSAGEPDLEVEYLFSSLTDMEVQEGRLREALRTATRDAGTDLSSWQETLLTAPGTRRYLTVVPDPSNTRRDDRTNSVQPRSGSEAGTRPIEEQSRGAETASPPSPVTDQSTGPVLDDGFDDDDEPPDEDDDLSDYDTSSLVPDPSIPPELPRHERQAAVDALMREMPGGVQRGFTPSQASTTGSRRRPPPRT